MNHLYPPSPYQQAIGSYYTYRSGQEYGGMGDIRESFDCNKVFQDSQLGGTIGTLMNAVKVCREQGRPESECAAIEQQIGRTNAAGARASKAVKQALNELGYGPLDVGGMWDAAAIAAWKKFAADNEVPAGPGLSKAGLCAMEAQLRGGALAGLGKYGPWILAALVGGAGYVLLKKKKKR